MIKIELDSREVAEALQRLSKRIDDMYPVFDDIGAALVSHINDGFNGSHDPWGKPWDALKHRSGKPLLDKGHLRASITHRPGRDSVAIGTHLEYAAVHQFGANLQRAARSQKAYFKVNKNTGASKFAKKSRANFEQWVTIGGHETTIPARPFMPIRNGAVDLPASWEQEILNTITQHITKAR